MTKTVKTYLMAIVAVIMVVGFSAFRLVEVNTEEVTYKSWYFIGNDETELGNPASYSDDPNDALLCDTGDEIVCEILAPEKDNSGEPDLEAPSDPDDEFSDPVSELIDDAMNNLGTPNITVQSFRLI